MAQIQSGVDSTLATVDSGNKALRTSLFDLNGNPIARQNGDNLPENGQSGLAVGGLNDGAFRLQRFDRYGNARVGSDTLLFRDVTEIQALSGTPVAPNLNQWSTAQSGFAVGAPTASGNQLTATTVTTAGAYAIARSLRYFQKIQKGPLFYRRRGRTVAYTGTVNEFGFGVPSTNVATITDSAHWRYTSTGLLLPVLTINGTEITGVDISSLVSNINYYTFEIIVDDDNVLFVCQDINTGFSVSEQTLHVPKGAAKVWTSSHLPIFERVYNASVPATAPQCFFSDVLVESFDVVNNKDWRHQIVMATQGGSEVYPGAYVAANSQTAQWANSAVPANAVLSNTAASYTTLGGKFVIASTAGAETDYALFAYVVPNGFTFICTSIRIDTYNAGAVSAGSANVLEWAVANNSSAVSLATAGLTRTPVGVQSLPLGSAIGALAATIDQTFDVPLRTDSMRTMHVILRMPIGTVTASQVLRGQVTLRGYFE